MWKYVSRRVKDTIELGINVRKSFTVQQTLNNNPNPSQQQHTRNERQTYSESCYRVVPRFQDPSRDKDKNDEKFKRKYTRLNNNHKFYLNALTWVSIRGLETFSSLANLLLSFISSNLQSTAIITGFYTSQLLCLYRRNQRLAFDGSRCYYSKYLLNTTKSIHRNVQYLLTPNGQQSIIASLSKLSECPFKKIKSGGRFNKSAPTSTRTVEDEFTDFKHFVDPGYKQYERFFENRGEFSSPNGTNVHNVSNDATSEVKVVQYSNDSQSPTKEESVEEKEDAAIDNAIRQLAQIVGELEFQMGLDSVIAEDFNSAVDHFKLSSSHNHPGGIFNLALCYEQGVGVKRNMKTARKLYEIACRLGHARAFYNLGVFHAQGLGGFSKSFPEAKKCFEKSADLGNYEALEALSLLVPETPKKLPVIDEIPEDEFFYKEPMMSSKLSAINHNTMRRIAVT